MGFLRSLGHFLAPDVVSSSENVVGYVDVTYSTADQGQPYPGSNLSLDEQVKAAGEQAAEKWDGESILKGQRTVEAAKQAVRDYYGERWHGKVVPQTDPCGNEKNVFVDSNVQLYDGAKGNAV